MVVSETSIGVATAVEAVFGPGACARNHTSLVKAPDIQLTPTNAACRKARPSVKLPPFVSGLQGKYAVGVVTKGTSRVRLRSLNGTLIVMLSELPWFRRKVKLKYDGEDTMSVYCGSAVFQK